MSLKSDRLIPDGGTDISYFMNVAATRGLIVIHDTSGSGAAMDQALAAVKAPTAAGGVSGTNPAGLLLNDVVNYDLTRQHLNQHQDQVQLGSKVTLLRRGWVVTNNVSGTPNAGDRAYYNNIGSLTNVNTGIAANSTAVGRFLSAKDADGYAKVEINITG